MTACATRDQDQRPGQPRQIYFCGQRHHAFRRNDARSARLIGVIRRNDSTRMAQMVERMERISASVA